MFSFRVQESKERSGDIKPPVRIWRVIKDRQKGFLEVNCQKSCSCSSWQAKTKLQQSYGAWSFCRLQVVC